LQDWVLCESNGYPDDVEVPTYRIWPLEVKGHFAGPFGSGIRNAPIPWACLPDKARGLYANYKYRQSIASIEESLRRTKSGAVSLATGDLAVALGTEVYQHQNCVQAWAEFSVGNLIELLNAVRNRILDFTLAVWKEAPTAGNEPNRASPGIADARVTQIFNTTVYGGAAQLVGNAHHSAVSMNVSKNDFESLATALREHAVGDQDIASLQHAIRDDGRITQPGRFGGKVSAWIAGMMKKAAEGSWAIGLEAAGNLLAQAITKFYGL
jgi:hypothetical protein